MTLIDWVMARLADEFRRDSSSAALGKALFATPESNVSFDSSMSQADLFVTLKRLASISNTLRSTLQQGESADRAVAALAISVVAGKLQDAIAQFIGQQRTGCGNHGRLAHTCLPGTVRTWVSPPLTL